MPHKDPARRKEYMDNYRDENKEQIKEKNKEHYEKNKEKIKEKNKEYSSKRYKDRKQNAIDSISSGEIIDQHNWKMWCNAIKIRAKQNKHPYSDDFTNEVMFEMMVQGCFYCEDVATTIDRIDSKLEHTPDNCVGCCHGCNISKGNADLSTFVRKAYYRVHEEYYDDDTDIWFVNKKKPSMSEYKSRANKKGVPFELTKEYFDDLTKGVCKYCKRSPTTYFGVDRIVPSLGYILGNVVSCCWDCNLDKLEDDVESMIARNERIITRVVSGKLCIDDCVKVILHNNKSS